VSQAELEELVRDSQLSRHTVPELLQPFGMHVELGLPGPGINTRQRAEVLFGQSQPLPVDSTWQMILE